jgi:hypothetical protein
VMASCRSRVMLATRLPSHAGDGTVKTTWPWRNVDVEPCWRWHCRCDLVVARCRCRVMLMTVLPSHAGDGAAEMI